MQRPRVVVVVKTLVLAALLAAAVVATLRSQDSRSVQAIRPESGQRAPSVGPASNPTATPGDRRCGQALINDWYGDGRLAAPYSGRCYSAALNLLPDDGARESVTIAYRTRVQR